MGQITITNLTKSYIERRRERRSQDEYFVGHLNRRLVLDGINLEFEHGEMVCILGPSGCGKSTLLRIAAGFDKADSGSVSVNGRRVTGPCSDLVFVFQQGGLLPWLTVHENVGLGVRQMRDKMARDAHIQEYIEMVDLDGFEGYYPINLSGGMQRRAELARALATQPEILFMDEPFNGLDFLTHMKMREEIVNLHEFMGMTILLVTHDIDDALIMGDRVVILGGRPAEVVLSKKIDFRRPRDYRADPALSELRNEIFLMLGVNYAI